MSTGPMFIPTLPPAHRFYTPATDGNLLTQLKLYCTTLNNQTRVDIPTRVILAFALNELAATRLTTGKLYTVNKPSPRSLADGPLPDLLYVPSYQWTPVPPSRDALLSLRPLDRLQPQSATFAKPSFYATETAIPDDDQLALPIYLTTSPTTPPCLPLHPPTAALRHPKEPEKGAWIWAAAATDGVVRAGLVFEVMEMGIVAKVVARGCGVGMRLEEAVEAHREYLSECRLEGGDACAEVLGWLRGMGEQEGAEMVMVRWGEAMGWIGQREAAVKVVGEEEVELPDWQVRSWSVASSVTP